jgi:uncharacterized phage infection (PIP) family protein YhgE
MYNNRRQITESELRNVIRDIIAEEIESGNLDEGLWDMMKAGGRAIGNAFKGDANRVGSSMTNAANNAAGAVSRGARSFGNAVGRGAQAVGNAVNRGAQAVGRGANAVAQGVNNAAQGVKDYAQSRGNAIKGMYNAQMNMNKINDLISTLDELQQSGVLTGPKMSQAIAAIKQQLQGAINRNKGTMTGWRNSVN